MTVDTKKIVRVDGLARAITASLNATIGKAGSIQGPKGDRGETGPKGDRGEAGTVNPCRGNRRPDVSADCRRLQRPAGCLARGGPHE